MNRIDLQNWFLDIDYKTTFTLYTNFSSFQIKITLGKLIHLLISYCKRCVLEIKMFAYLISLHYRITAP